MLTIGEIVALDEQARFHNDVQLSAFNTPAKNMALLRSYLFTGTAPNTEVAGARTLSSIDLLEQVVQAFLSDRLENRIVAIANYGHGKSHLALALANYFSKPANSAEVQLLTTKIASAVSDSAKAKRYREFKENHGEFLVVRIRGDEPQSLREQILAGIETAIDEHPATAGRRPKFWYTTAQSFLERLSEGNRAKADAYLEQFSMDVPQLLNQVKQRKDVYELCVDLFAHLHGVKPNFGGEISLSKVVDWAVTTCCSNDGPIKGILFLFDEFSSYIERHANKGAALELQDLLNGIEEKQGKAVFLAFAQHDPVTLANNLSLQGAVRESLAKALTRVPKRYVLFSLMESVIDSYLMQDESDWQSLVQDPKLRGHIFQATDLAFDQFQGRYQRELRWPFEKFQETVTKGCFPLHPVTTVLLCNLRYATTGDFGVPRTVLGFVLEQLTRLKAEPAVVDNRINWILPTYLVDYFEPRLRGETYSAYKNAVRRLDPQAPTEHEGLLKAVLLYEMAGLKAAGKDQVHFLAQCTGINEQQALDALKALNERRCLRYDSLRRVNTFFASDESPEALEELIAQKVSASDFTESDADEMVRILAKFEGISLGQISVSVEWGENSDWAARETMLPARFATEEKLQSLVEGFEPLMREISSGDRGCVVWLWAESQDELTGLRASLTAELDKAMASDAPIPVVFVMPTDPNPELLEAYQRYVALDEFTTDERQRVGQKTYEHEVGMAKGGLLRALQLLRGEQTNYLDMPRAVSAFRVPKAYRSPINLVAKPSVRRVLETSYKIAYRNAPPAFFTQYKINNARLKNATKLVANLMLQNAPEALRKTVQADSVASDLCTKFLQKQWGLLASDYRIQEPDNQAVRRAWQVLDEAFSAGCKEKRVADTIVALLNAPNGYDANTASLLFCAWFGYHSHDLQVNIFGRVSNRSALTELLSNGPKDFINEICITRPVSLARRDPGQIVKDVQHLLEKVQVEKFTQAQAQKDMATLDEFAQDERYNPEIRALAANAAATLSAGLETARQYDQQAAEISSQLSGNLQAVSSQLSRIGRLPQASLVLATANSPAEIRNTVLARLAEVVEADCKKFENLQKLTQVDHLLAQLKERRQIVAKLSIAPLLERFDRAMENVNAQAARLESEEREEEVRVAIRAMDVTSGLCKLQEFRSQLEAISSRSEATMKLRDEQLKAVNQQITQLEEGVAKWKGLLDAVITLAGLNAEHDNILRIAYRYEDTPYAASVTQALQRLKILQQYLFELATLQSSNDGNLRNPGDVEQLLLKADELRAKYGEQLSPGQTQEVDSAVLRIKRDAKGKEDRARVWLRERQAEYTTVSDPIELKHKLLNHSPSFLPDEARSDLVTLIKDVQKRIDADIIMSIEQRFLEIDDIDQRRRCLLRLEQLLQPVTYPQAKVDGHR